MSSSRAVPNLQLLGVVVLIAAAAFAEWLAGHSAAGLLAGATLGSLVMSFDAGSHKRSTSGRTRFVLFVLWIPVTSWIVILVSRGPDSGLWYAISVLLASALAPAAAIRVMVVLAIAGGLALSASLHGAAALAAVPGLAMLAIAALCVGRVPREPALLAPISSRELPVSRGLAALDPAGILQWRHDGDTVHCSPQAQRLLGQPGMDELTQSAFWALLEPAQELHVRQMVVDQLQGVRQQAGHPPSETQITLQPAGATRWLYLRLTATLVDDEPWMVGWIVKSDAGLSGAPGSQVVPNARSSRPHDSLVAIDPVVTHQGMGPLGATTMEHSHSPGSPDSSGSRAEADVPLLVLWVGEFAVAAATPRPSLMQPFTSIHVASDAAAIEALIQRRPDLILIDLHLPDSAVLLARQMRQMQVDALESPSMFIGVFDDAQAESMDRTPPEDAFDEMQHGPVSASLLQEWLTQCAPPYGRAGHHLAIDPELARNMPGYAQSRAQLAASMADLLRRADRAGAARAAHTLAGSPGLLGFREGMALCYEIEKLPTDDRLPIDDALQARADALAAAFSVAVRLLALP